MHTDAKNAPVSKESLAEMQALAGEFTVATLRNLRDLAITASDLPDIKFCATMLPKIAELVPNLVDKTSQHQHQVIFDISRVPGAAKALQAEVVDVVPKSLPPVRVGDAPEPKYGASDEVATTAVVPSQALAAPLPDIAGDINDLVLRTPRTSRPPASAAASSAPRPDPLGGLSISGFVFDDA